MWNDEAETAMYATSILSHGYPKVHDGNNVLYVYDGPDQLRAYDAHLDAYLNSGWLQFYFATPGAWVAQHISDPTLRTIIMRFPFALAAIGALALMAWTVAAPRRRRGLVFSAFIGLSAVCIPLVLHMREVRYYALSLLLVAFLLWLVKKFHMDGLMSYRKYKILLCIALIILFFTFHPLFFALLASLALYAVRHVRSHWRAILREIIPLAISLGLLIPAMIFFRTFTLSRNLNDTFGFSMLEYVKNYGTILIDLAKYTMFIPAFMVTVVTAILFREVTFEQRTRVRSNVNFLTFLWLVTVTVVSIVSGTALLYQRYYLVLMPISTLLFIIAMSTIYALLPAVLSVTQWPRLYRGIVLSLSATALIPIALSWQVIVGHVHEIVYPYQGTVDVTVTYIQSHYSDPSTLVIATNYEELSYMYYLKSHVIIGQVLNNLTNDVKLQPDIIIPRLLWKVAGLPYLDAFRKAGTYNTVRFPIQDFYTNNLPELRRPLLVHQFSTRRVGSNAPLVMYVR